MSTITKDFARTGDASRDVAQSGAGGKVPSSQRTGALGAEIPVVVHASRYSAGARGTGKHQPAIHEETHTVIVFPQGAVVRLSASMTAGELVVLTNQQSGADVLCRVSGVKTQPGIQNYVDLEFTQRAPGFWGDCFAVERSGRSEELPSAAAPLTAKGTSAEPAPMRQNVLVARESDSNSPKPGGAVAPERVQVTAMPDESRPSRSTVAASLGSLPASLSPGLGLTGSRSAASLMRPVHLQGPQVLAAEPSSQSKKFLVVAAVAVVVAGLTVGGWVLRRPKQQAASLSGVASTTENAAPQSASPSAASGAEVNSAAVEPAVANSSVNAAVTVEPAVVKANSNASAAEVPQPAPSRRPSVAIGQLSRPIAKAAAASTSSEPTPVLTAQASAPAMDNALFSSGTSGPVAPTAPARASSRVDPPRLIFSPAPKYPAMASSQRVEGVVIIDTLVDADGMVSDMKVISGPTLLRQAAMDALRNWRYAPTRLDGQPVSVHTQVSITFHLQ